MNELERIEALAYCSAAEAAGGVVYEVRGGTCLAVPALPVPTLNRVVGVRGNLDVDAVLAFYSGRGTHALLSVPPVSGDLERELEANGFERTGAWMKFERGVEPADVETALTVETGERIDGRPSTSYRNILRAGFAETYLRANWRSP